MKKLFAAVFAALFLLCACAERSVSAPGSAGASETTESVSGSTSESTSESASESASESTSESAPESTSESMSVSVSGAASESTPEGASESPSAPAEESVPADGSAPSAGDTAASADESAAAKPVGTAADPANDWRLVLVNPWHKLEGEMDVDLVLPPSGRNENRHMVDRRIVDDLEEMIAAAKADGVSLLIDYGYRSFAQSEALFEKQINSQLAANPSYTREQAEEAAKAWVAPPGTSDHHTGLALDIVTPDYQMLNDGFADTPAGQWMAKHSWEYGFVIRFPQGKTDITGIAYESWHLRYVGRDNAEIMYENNWCLEEYLEYLTQK